MLVICASDNIYVNNLLNKFSYTREMNLDNIEIYKCLYDGHDFLIVITGYGKVNIGSSLMYTKLKYNVSCIICIGTCGSVVQNNHILAAVIPTGTLQFDVDFMTNRCKTAVIPNLKSSLFTTNLDINNCLIEICNLIYVDYSNDLIASADMTVNNNSLSRSINYGFDSGAVDIESGCVGEFCYINNIPYSCIKIVSNYSFNNNLRLYDLYNTEASNLCQKITYNFIKAFYNE